MLAEIIGKAEMIAVIFEVRISPGRQQDYLDIAAALRDELESIDGFLSVERFVGLSDTNRILSLSFWRDEEAIRRWRTASQHRAAQRAGRAGIFDDYRLRIAAVLRDYGMRDREQAPRDSEGMFA
jgi:heme-degrading monooxygenase HmoA